jgi:branched-subunit amino acid ABC-type transport system permease component
VWQQIISGLQAGSWYSLMALAIVLVLKATDVPNFAMAELGLFPAFCTWALMDGAGLSWWLAVPAGLLIGVVLAVVVERTAIRPILAENHFATVLMTIAVFVVINAIVQLVWGSQPRKIDSPFAGSFTVAGQVVAYEQLVSIAAGLVVMVGLILFFRTPLGVQMQAIAEDRVTPRLLGVSVTTVFRTSWAPGLAAHRPERVRPAHQGLRGGDARRLLQHHRGVRRRARAGRRREPGRRVHLDLQQDRDRAAGHRRGAVGQAAGPVRPAPGAGGLNEPA